MANTAKVTQSVVEFVTLSTGTAKVTQSVLEFVVGLGVTCNNPPNGQVGIAYHHTFLSGGGTAPVTFSISAGSLPPGLSLAAATGIVTGTPTTAGTYAFTVLVTDAGGGSSSVSCSIVIASQSLTIVLYGWKLYRDQPCVDDNVELAQAPQVKRAL